MGPKSRQPRSAPLKLEQAQAELHGLHDHTHVSVDGHDDEDMSNGSRHEPTLANGLVGAELANGHHESAADANANGHFSYGTMEALGGRTRSLVEAVNKLEQLGVEASNIPLPKIVAVGDQSAGKSSLIEGISSIRIPRAANTCTRCPLQISLTTEDTSSWKITIHKKYHFHPSDSTFTSSSSDFGRWKLLSRPEDGPTIPIHSEAEVEDMIAKAQKAILCPRDDAMAIMRGLQPSTPLEEFSPNVIKLEISGPNLPCLMLYDLPGVISQSTTDDDSLPDLIQGLVTEYVKSPNTIVLLACPIGTDHVNSKAARVVKDLGALARCVGVITKPDKLDKSDEKQWVDMLAGSKHILGHGYFVTRQLGADDRFESNDKTRLLEKDFFDRDRRWNSSSLKKFSDRFGTIKLQNKLSELLANEISKKLPDIERTVSQEVAKLTEQLFDFPKPEQNAYPTVLNIVGKIETGTEKLMRGDGQKDLLLEWKAIAETYSDTLKAMKPVVVISNTGYESQWDQGSSDTPIAIESDDEEDHTSTRAGSKRPMPPPLTPSKRQRATPSTPRNGRSGAKKRSPTLYNYTSSADLDPKENASKWTFEEIRKTIRSESTSGIPRATDPSAEDALIRQSLEKWTIPLSEMFEAVKSVVSRFVQSMAETLLRTWSNTDFKRLTKRAITQLIDERCSAALHRAQEILRAKQYKPFTLNVESLEILASKELNMIKQSRRVSRARQYIRWKHRVQTLEPQDVENKARLVKDVDLGEDPYAREVVIMSEIRGYYSLAVGSMVDVVCELVQYEVLEGCASDIREHLDRSLSLNSADCIQNADRLLSEDPQRMAKREEIEAEVKKFKTAQEFLKDMWA